jgi:hypothetical protein
VMTLWSRLYACLKHRSTSMRLHGAISQKAVTFRLTSVITWNLTRSEVYHWNNTNREEMMKLLVVLFLQGIHQ